MALDGSYEFVASATPPITSPATSPHMRSNESPIRKRATVTSSTELAPSDGSDRHRSSATPDPGDGPDHEPKARPRAKSRGFRPRADDPGSRER